MKLSRGAIGMYLGLVFVCGGVLGFFANRLYSVGSPVIATATKNPPSPDDFRAKMVADYKRRMNLSDAQVLNLNLILDETRAKVQAEQKTQRERSRPVMQKVLQEQTDRINAMLSPDQRVEYEKIRAERRERQRKAKTNGGGGRNGPGF